MGKINFSLIVLFEQACKRLVVFSKGDTFALHENFCTRFKKCKNKNKYKQNKKKIPTKGKLGVTVTAKKKK